MFQIFILIMFNGSILTFDSRKKKGFDQPWEDIPILNITFDGQLAFYKIAASLRRFLPEMYYVFVLRNVDDWLKVLHRQISMFYIYIFITLITEAKKYFFVFLRFLEIFQDWYIHFFLINFLFCYDKFSFTIPVISYEKIT